MLTSQIQSLHTIVYAVGRLNVQGIELLGTCFLLNKTNLFATAAHVVSGDPSNLVLITSNDAQLGSYQDTSKDQLQCVSISIAEIDTIRDICILRLGDQANALANIQIGGTDDVNVSDEIVISGYPHCINGRFVLTYQRTEVGAKILISAAGVKSKHIVTNIQTRPGQSGSPIFRHSDGKLVAIVIGSYAPAGGGGISLGGVDPHTLHQTTHALSSHYILDMI